MIKISNFLYNTLSIQIDLNKVSEMQSCEVSYSVNRKKFIYL